MFENKFCAKRTDNGEWVHGGYVSYGYVGKEKFYIVPHYASALYTFEVDPATVRRFTGKKDKNGAEIYVGDITELMVDGDLRRFIVSFKDADREVVSHPDFDSPTAKVRITGLVFSWEGFDLFPCIHEDGHDDIADMVKVGNVYDNPEFFAQAGEESR